MHFAAHGTKRPAVVEKSAKGMVVLIDQHHDLLLVARRCEPLYERIEEIAQRIVPSIFDFRSQCFW